MPKPKKLSRKELLREPEVVTTLQGRALDWVRANQKTATIAAAVLLAAVALVVGVRQYSAHQEAQAMDLYGQAQMVLGANQPGEAAKALQSLEAVSEQYPRTAAARYATLARANMLYEQGRPAEAAKLYQDCLDRFREGDSLEMLTKQGLAYSKLAAGDAAGAEKLFGDLAKAGFGAGSAQLQLGLIYQRQGKLKEAVAAYKKADQLAQGVEKTLAKARLSELAPEGPGGA